jgi:hypothetical protein
LFAVLAPYNIRHVCQIHPEEQKLLPVSKTGVVLIDANGQPGFLKRYLSSHGCINKEKQPSYQQ